MRSWPRTSTRCRPTARIKLSSLCLDIDLRSEDDAMADRLHGLWNMHRPFVHLGFAVVGDRVMADADEVTVLLIEDDQTFSDMYRFRLELDGYRVFEARDGHTALQLAAAVRPDLIFLDIKLPGLDS